MEKNNKLKINLEKTHNEIIKKLREYFKNSGFEKAVIGLSGGVDSALVAYLLRDALGKENVFAIMMPYKTSNPDSLNHAKLVVKDLKIESKIVEITPMIDAFFETYEKEASTLRKGNKMARERMSILYDYSAKEKALVVGTSNKTEIFLGYSTQFGDSASAVNPIGDLFKSQIWDLSTYVGVPDVIVNKKPSADLWLGQTDEDELGIKYREADEILYRLLIENKSREEIISENFREETVDKILHRMKNTEYKRRMPFILNLEK